MRIRGQDHHHQANLPFPGSLLLAHPAMLDSSFKHSVVLLTSHSEDTGSLGVIVNRPLRQSLGEYDPALKHSALSRVPVYSGGPVAEEQLILVAWKWSPVVGSFKLFFGISAEKAEEILAQDPAFKLRAFLGHAGWGEGQLDGEIEEGAWVPSVLSPEIESGVEKHVWQALLSRQSAELQLLAHEPEDPSMN